MTKAETSVVFEPNAFLKLRAAIMNNDDGDEIGAAMPITVVSPDLLISEQTALRPKVPQHKSVSTDNLNMNQPIPFLLNSTPDTETIKD